MNRNQYDIIPYLQEEIRVLEEQLGKKSWRRKSLVIDRPSIRPLADTSLVAAAATR